MATSQNGGIVFHNCVPHLSVLCLRSKSETIVISIHSRAKHIGVEPQPIGLFGGHFTERFINSSIERRHEFPRCDFRVVLPRRRACLSSLGFAYQTSCAGRQSIQDVLAMCSDAFSLGVMCLELEN
jgi:hypothetical protein